MEIEKTACSKVCKPRGRPLSFDRDQALEQAMHVFWQRGYEAASISELTAAMGITAPSLYTAFGDKERLVLEAIERTPPAPAAATRGRWKKNPPSTWPSSAAWKKPRKN